MNTFVVQAQQYNIFDTKRVHKQSLNNKINNKLISKHKTIFICNLSGHILAVSCMQ